MNFCTFSMFEIIEVSSLVVGVLGLQLFLLEFHLLRKFLTPSDEDITLTWKAAIKETLAIILVDRIHDNISLGHISRKVEHRLHVTKIIYGNACQTFTENISRSKQYVVLRCKFFNTQVDELFSDNKMFETTMFSNNTGFKLEADSVTINDYYSAISF